ncbi:unnamed protein product [Gulo gulo]|uniref:Uncharacterized protein n=1 Tax=Gulo gulo TaxID=48420 RepID=A0A9X9M7Y8_GULGU|nr:unnamed protein product [Gulo gulo]
MPVLEASDGMGPFSPAGRVLALEAFPVLGLPDWPSAGTRDLCRGSVQLGEAPSRLC